MYILGTVFMNSTVNTVGIIFVNHKLTKAWCPRFLEN